MVDATRTVDTGRTGPRKLRGLLAGREAIAARLRGLTFEAIGAELGVSRQRAHALVSKAVGQAAAEREGSAEALRQLELERCDRLQLAHWPAAIGGDVVATAVVLKLMERRAKLLGLDAALKLDVVSRGEVLQLTESMAREAEAAIREVVADETLATALLEAIAARWRALG